MGIVVQHFVAQKLPSVADSAGQLVTKDVLVRVASQPLNVSLVPEGATCSGIEATAFVGRPWAPIIGATAHLELGDGTGHTSRGETDAHGYALVVWTPARLDASIIATSKQGTSNSPVSASPSVKAKLGPVFAVMVLSAERGDQGQRDVFRRGLISRPRCTVA